MFYANIFSTMERSHICLILQPRIVRTYIVVHDLSDFNFIVMHVELNLDVQLGATK